MAEAWTFDIGKVESNDIEEINRVRAAMAVDHPTNTAFGDNEGFITYPGYENAGLEVKFCVWVSKLLERAPSRLLNLPVGSEAGRLPLQTPERPDDTTTGGDSSVPLLIPRPPTVEVQVSAATSAEAEPPAALISTTESREDFVEVFAALDAVEDGLVSLSTTGDIVINLDNNNTTPTIDGVICNTTPTVDEVPSNATPIPTDDGVPSHSPPTADGVPIAASIVLQTARGGAPAAVAPASVAVIMGEPPIQPPLNQVLTAPRSSPRHRRPIPPGIPLATKRSSTADKGKTVLSADQLLAQEEERRARVIKQNAALAAERELERVRAREIEDAQQQRLDDDRRRERKERKKRKEDKKKRSKKEKRKLKGKKGRKSRRSSSSSTSASSSNSSSDSEETELNNSEGHETVLPKAATKEPTATEEEAGQLRLRKLDLNKYTRIPKGKDAKAVKNRISQTASLYFPIDEWKHWRQLKRDKRLMRSFHDEVRNVWKNGREIDDAWINGIASRVLKDRHYRQKAAVRATFNQETGTYRMPDGMEETLWLPIVAELTTRRDTPAYRRAHMGDNAVDSVLRRRTTNVWGYGGYPHFFNTFCTVWKRAPTEDEIDFAREHSSKELHRKLKAEAEGIMYMPPPPVLRVQLPVPAAPRAPTGLPAPIVAPVVSQAIPPAAVVPSGSHSAPTATTPAHAPPPNASGPASHSDPSPRPGPRERTIKVTMGRNNVIHTDSEEELDLGESSTEDERVETETQELPQQQALVEEGEPGLNEDNQEKKRKNPYAPSRDRPATTRATSSGKDKKQKPSKKKGRKDRS